MLRIITNKNIREVRGIHINSSECYINFYD